MAMIEQILIRMGLDGTQLDSGLRQSETKIKQFSKVAKTAFAAIGVGLTAGGAVQAINSLRDFVDDIGTRAASIGVGAEFLQRFAYAAEQTGVNTDKAQIAMEKLAQKIGLANTVGGEYEKIFKTFGITTRGKTLEQILMEVSDIMAAMPSQFERNALAMKLFEEGGTSLIATLQGGSEGLMSLMEQAAALTDVQIAAIDRADKALKDFGTTIKTLAGGRLADVIEFFQFLGSTKGKQLPWGGGLKAYSDFFVADKFAAGFSQGVGNMINQGRNQAADAKAKAEAELKEKKKALKEYNEIMRALDAEELRRQKAITAEYEKRMKLVENLNTALDAMNRARSDGRKFSMNEVLGLNPDDLNDTGFANFKKLQRAAELEKEAKYLSLEGNDLGARWNQDEAAKLRASVTGIQEADRVPYGEQEKRAADALEALMEYADSGGLPVSPVMGE